MITIFYGCLCSHTLTALKKIVSHGASGMKIIFALSAFSRYWLLEHVLYTIRMYKIINLSYQG